MTVGLGAGAIADKGKRKGSELHHQDEFLYNYYTFESVYDGDHNGAVRVFAHGPSEPMTVGSKRW